MARIGNALTKGLKSVGKVALGGVAYGLAATLSGWHPPTTGSAATDLAVGYAWNTFGVGIGTGLVSMLLRLAQYNPLLDPQNRPLPN